MTTFPDVLRWIPKVFPSFPVERKSTRPIPEATSRKEETSKGGMESADENATTTGENATTEHTWRNHVCTYPDAFRHRRPHGPTDRAPRHRPAPRRLRLGRRPRSGGRLGGPRGLRCRRGHARHRGGLRRQLREP